MLCQLYRSAAIALAFAVGACSSVESTGTTSSGDTKDRRELHVALYPFIPDSDGAYFAIEQAFEARFPEIDLKISLNSNYYSHDPADGGVLYEHADVYEIDSVFLADFVEAQKIAPLPAGVANSIGPMIDWADQVSRDKNGNMLGAPHWVCGNFLLYRSKDGAIASAKTLGAIELALGHHPRSLLIDLYGKSTLGEMYLDALMDREGSAEAALAHLDPAHLDEAALGSIKRALKLSPKGFGRDADYHDRLGFYARQFARGHGRALVGYSEETFYALTETAQSCRKDEKCLKQSDIAVAEWPLADRGSHPIAWVDMLAIDKGLTEQKRADAEQFIRFMMEPATFKLFLIPAWGAAPRYLLPARDDLYTDAEVVKAAPLYASFHEHMKHATPITDRKLNERLRVIGAKLNKELPLN